MITVTMSMSESDTGDEQLLTLEELTTKVGMSVRNVRFYTARKLVPPPIKIGRQGFYSDEHVAHLELVQELRGHGFTLAAIEKYVAGIRPDATVEDIALHRTMLAPWQDEPPVMLTRRELDSRAGRRLSDEELETLTALGIVVHEGSLWRVAVSQLSIGLGLLDLGFPTQAARAAAEVYAAHGQAMAAEMGVIFTTMVRPAYRGSSQSDALREVVERLKPLSLASVAAAYAAAMDDINRASVERRTSV